MRIVFVCLLFSILISSSAEAACTSDLCASENPLLVEAFRAELQARCECETSATHAKYRRCVRSELREAERNGLLSSACARAIRACENRSTCGRPEAVVCCGERGAGPIGRVKANAGRCRRGRLPG